MAKRYSKLNLRGLLFLTLIAIVAFASFSACKKRNQTPSNYSYEVDAPTGPVDENGDIIIITNWITNNIVATNTEYEFITNDIAVWGEIFVTNYVTNIIKGETVIKTNYVYVTNTFTETTNIINVVPDTNNYVSKWHSSTMYRVYAPFAGVGAEGDWKYTNLSYLDTKGLSEWWKRVIHRYAFEGGNEFYISNPYDYNGSSYFYFDNNMNIRWSKRPNDIAKKFVQGLIVQYRGGAYEGAYAIAGLYQLNNSSATMRGWGNDGVNLLQGYYVRKNRSASEYDIVVLNTGHVIDGRHYGFQIYDTSISTAYGWKNPFKEQRPEYYMSKITLVLDLWKNLRPYPIEQQNMQFKYGKVYRPN